MRFSTFLSTFLVVPLLLALSLPAFAAVMVLPVEGTNLEQGEVDAIGQMVAAAYQLERKETVHPPSEVKKVLAETGSYNAAAQRLGATEYVYVTAVRLDQRIVITAATYTQDGKLIHSAKISATSLDDVEAASDRLARALVRKQSTTDARTLDNVTKTESGTPARVGTQRIAGFKGSFTYPIGWGEEIAPMMSAGFDLKLEGRAHFIEFGVGLTFPAADYERAYGGLYTEIGASFYLSDTSTSPYVGFGVLPRLMSASPANIGLYAQGGAMFFRESTTRVYTDLRVAQNLLPVGFSGAGQRYPTEITLSVGVGF